MLKTHLMIAFLACAFLQPQPYLAQTTSSPSAPQPHEAISKPGDHPDPDHPSAIEPQPNSVGDDTDQAFALKRSQWFVQQRAYPFAHIPAGARWSSLQQKTSLQNSLPLSVSARKVSPQSSFSSNAWTFDGPKPFAFSSISTPVSGRATSIAVNPTTPSTIYLGTAAGGVWKTTDSGATWNPLTDSQASLAIGALAIDPINPLIIYAGTGEPDSSSDSYYGQGLLKSTDGGSTWTLTRTPFTSGTTAPDFTQIVLQPGNSSLILASTLSGLYRSTDAGATWSDVLPMAVTGVIFDKANSSVMYAGINGYYSASGASSPVYKSTNAGLTWTPMPGSSANALPAVSSVFRTAIAEDSTGANLYAAMARSDFGAPGSLYKSVDGGANWTKLASPNASDGLDWYRNNIAVVPNTNPNVLYATGASLYQSLDGGLTWSRSTSGEYADQHGFAFSPDGTKLYLADDGGIFVASSPATANPTFTSLNATIGTTTFYPGFSIIPGQANSALAGTQDHGLDLYTNALLWTPGDGDRYCGDGGGAFVDAQNTHAYAHCQGGSANWVANAFGANSPNTYVSAQAGINFNDRLPWVADIKGDPQNIATIYTATNHLYQSTNYAATWTSISPDLTAGSATINTIAVAPTNSSVVYTGAGDGTIEVSTNALQGASSTWTKISGLPNRNINKILVMPDSPQDVYVAFGGFGTGHIFNSTNGGTSWTDLSGNIPNTPVNSILVDPALRGTIYAATDTGVYYTTNAGTNWAPLGVGLPNVVVQDIAMYTATRQIRVITHGRGAWDITIPATGFTASTSALSFAPQNVGSTSAAQTITLLNSFLSTTINLTAITINGNFAQTNTCGATLAPGASCSVSVTFSPLSIAALTGTLSITSSSGNLSINLSGTGLGVPLANLSSAALNFNSQPLGTATASQTVTLNNSGTAALASIAISITGANASDFSQTTTCGSSLAIGASCTVSIVFNPTALGTRTATVAIADNAANSPQNISVSGAGTPPFTLTTGQPSVSVQPGSTAIYTVQLSAATGTLLTSAVQLGCTGGPSTTTCTVLPLSVAAGTAGQALTVTVTTTAPTTGSLQMPLPYRGPPSSTWAVVGGIAVLGSLLRRRRKAIGLLLLLLGAISSATLLNGCSKSSNGSPGTTAGSYTLTVSAQSATYQTTQNLTLVIP